MCMVWWDKNELETVMQQRAGEGAQGARLRAGNGPRKVENSQRRWPYTLTCTLCLLLSLNLFHSLWTHEHQLSRLLFQEHTEGQLTQFPLSHTQSPLHLSPPVASHQPLSSSFFTSPFFCWDQNKPADLLLVSERPQICLIRFSLSCFLPCFLRQ